MNVKLTSAVEGDSDFAFEVKRQAMGPHIKVKWGWDEDFQRTLHNQRYSEKPWFIILLDTKPIGTVSIHKIEAVTRFGEFYLLDEYRGRGLGTYVLRRFLAQCDQELTTVTLEYLKWNPVGALYKRSGFEVTHENDIHYFMTRKPKALSD